MRSTSGASSRARRPASYRTSPSSSTSCFSLEAARARWSTPTRTCVGTIFGRDLPAGGEPRPAARREHPHATEPTPGIARGSHGAGSAPRLRESSRSFPGLQRRPRVAVSAWLRDHVRDDRLRVSLTRWRRGDDRRAEGLERHAEPSTLDDRTALRRYACVMGPARRRSWRPCWPPPPPPAGGRAPGCPLHPPHHARHDARRSRRAAAPARLRHPEPRRPRRARDALHARRSPPAPLTLPAHCSLLTGLDPSRHGVHDNGTASLPAGDPHPRHRPRRARVSHRRLRRLARPRPALRPRPRLRDLRRRMTAERMGEQGYPERDGAAVTAAALAWARRVPAGRPFFLWVHYYDAHAPYTPPGVAADAPVADRYAGEIAYVDREVGRLLAGLRRAPDVVAAVGDHGEMLGEHGEDTHGIFLYRASLEVPLIVGRPRRRARRRTRPRWPRARLAATLLALAGAPAPGFGPPLPGHRRRADPRRSPTARPSCPPPRTDGARCARCRTTAGATSPRRGPSSTTTSRIPASRGTSRRSGRTTRDGWPRALRRRRTPPRARIPPRRRPSTPRSRRRCAASAISRGPAARARGTIDPKDGIALLREFDRAKQAPRRGTRCGRRSRAFEALVRQQPGQRALPLAAGRGAEGGGTARRRASRP